MSSSAAQRSSRGTAAPSGSLLTSITKLILVLPGLSLAFVCGCSSPAKRVDILAHQLGFDRTELKGGEFLHVVYAAQVSEATGPLHVYIEGDGKAWLDRVTVSRDPTPHNPLMLKLMALDRKPSLYLGRPCYLGLADTARCSPLYWTNLRFSPEVVQSMKAALLQIMKKHGKESLILMGHSGGGTLAMLLARELKAAKAVVTLAGNLDIAAWAAHHDYSLLEGSMNPVDFADSFRSVAQTHCAGGRDQIVPASLIRDATRQTGGRFLLYESFDHVCCWHEVWPSILDQITAQ